MPKFKEHLSCLYRVNYEKSRHGYLRLDMNENVVGLPKDFIDNVLNKVTPEYLSSYPEYTKLKNKLAAANNLLTANIILGNGSDAIIKYIFDAYISNGDNILLTDPAFAMYPIYSKMFNANTVNITYNSDLSFPKDVFLDSINSDIKMAVLVNPNNPIGTGVDEEYVIKLLDKAKANSVFTIIDEAYFYFYPKTFIKYIKKYDNLIVLRTFSKLCGIASARIGFAAASPKIIDNLNKVRPTFDVNGLAVLFAEAIIDNEYIIKDQITIVRDGKEFIINKLKENSINYRDSEANFILIDCENLENANRIKQELEKDKILVSSGFRQKFLEKYIRVTIGSKEQMDKFYGRFSFYVIK